MSQRGRGSGPHDDDPDGEDADRERVPESSPLLPPASRPIAPYDPYRPASSDLPRRPTLNIAADPFEPPLRPPLAGDDDPILTQDDPLSAEAWQLELDEAPARGEHDATLPEFALDAPSPPRRTRRKPPSMRGGIAAEPGAQRAPRRSRSSAASARGRAARPAVTMAMPRVVTGSSLVADQAALVL